MPRIGLTQQRVIEAATELIEQGGVEFFSMRALAEKLNVKTASLYNHVESMDALLADVCAHALKMQRDALMHSVALERGRAAVGALADAYRQFAKAHRQLYRLIMQRAAACGERSSEAAQCIVDPFMYVLQDSALTLEEKVHWQRVLRGLVHGFVAQEEAGFFAHLPENVNESFQIAIQCYVDGLLEAEKRKKA